LRLAVFTNQFPARVCTFFARDMRSLVEAGIEIDVFPIYPLEPALWRYVPPILAESILPKSRVHHVNFSHSLLSLRPLPVGSCCTFLRDATAITAAALRFGVKPLMKNIYVLLKGLAWTQKHPNRYDHILAYWGNYTASCAYIYHRLTARNIPFSLFLHAEIDLYNTQEYLRKKLLYADNILTCSDFNIKFIRECFPDIFHRISDKLFVHYHGLDLTVFSYGRDSRQQRKIIAVGRLERKKGFHYLLHATHELKQQGIDIEVEFIGDGTQADALRILARKLRIVERIKFRGWLTSDEVRTAMRHATILVHPSPDLGDGVPNVIKEAMAVGTPVVASEVAGIPELLDNGRNGMLVPPKDVKALAHAIKALLASDTLRQQYAEAARKYAEQRFDLWHNGQRLAALLRATARPQAMKNPRT
jgi:glycosyltransferase involved in cell wall biosynthesis